MKKLVILLALVFATAVYAQDKSQPVTKTPAIPAELQRDFFKAQSEFIQAQNVLNGKQSAYQDLLIKLGKSCGETYLLQLDGSGYPVCVAQPAKEKTELAPAKK